MELWRNLCFKIRHPQATSGGKKLNVDTYWLATGVTWGITSRIDVGSYARDSAVHEWSTQGGARESSARNRCEHCWNLLLRPAD